MAVNDYENRVLITGDKDFGEMIFRFRMAHCGVILLRLTNERSSNKISALEIVLKNHKQDIAKNFLIASESFVRVIKH
jgi:predicted nuclease of predicted toxin-antitoxin system